MNWPRIKKNLGDARKFGPSFLLRHVARLSGRETAIVSVRPVGPVHVRLGDSDIDVVRQIFGHNSYALGANHPATKRMMARYEAIVAAGSVPVIIDAGANIGMATLWFRSQYPLAGIVAIEPEPDNVRILHLNLDGRANIEILDAAIGAEPGFVAIESDGTGWGARTVLADKGIEVVTVQQAIETIANGTPFIVKIDIEGFENELFADNVDWVSDAYAVIIEPHDWMLPGKGTSRNFQKVMARHDFEILLRGENLIYVRV